MSIDAHIMKRSEARELGLVHYYTGNACPKGHVGMRYTANGVCVECAAMQSKAWRENNPERYQAGREKWAEENREYMRVANKARTEKRAAARAKAKVKANKTHKRDTLTTRSGCGII